MTSGPHVQLAAICEKVLREGDGVLSLIRVVDRSTVAIQGPNLPSELPPGRIRMTLVVALRAGDARGRVPITIETVSPAGVSVPTPPQEFHAMFEGEDLGVNLILELDLEVIEGVYWFVVRADGRELTRTPHRVVYLPVTTVQ